MDPRYGYTEQIVVPTVNTLLQGTVTSGTKVPAGTMGVYYYDTSGGNAIYYATSRVYHTLGWANEYEQGSSNALAEPWDYFPFNDRDFTSVAELLLVPGCSPGLFTKQFVEFAPNAGNVSTIFGLVTPTVVPPAGVPVLTIVAPATSTTTGGTTTTTGGATAPTGTTGLQPYSTGSTPFGYAYSTATSGRPSTPQPRTYPYLNDEFFYTGSGAGTTLDAGSCGWRHGRRRLVQDVRVLRGSEPIDHGDRHGGRGIEFRLVPERHQARAAQPEPDHG